MSQNKLSLWVKKLSPISWLYIAGVVVLTISGFIWYKGVYLSSNNVFWGTMNNNLATTSITRHIIDEQQGQKNDQYIRLVFGAQNVAQSKVTLTQTDQSGKSVVKSETIGTPKTDFSRYVSINTSQKTSSGKMVDSSSIEGLWAKNEGNQFAKPQYFQQSVLSIVPFANFNSKQRSELIHIMKDRKVYEVKSVKSDKKDGKSVFVYEVDINAEAYINMLKSYAKMLGLGDIGLDASQYAGAAPLKTELTIDKLARQLVSVTYSGGSQGETLSSQGMETPVDIPTKTISISELQDRVQKTLK